MKSMRQPQANRHQMKNPKRENIYYRYAIKLTAIKLSYKWSINAFNSRDNAYIDHLWQGRVGDR